MNPKYLKKLLDNPKISETERESLTAMLTIQAPDPEPSSYDPALDEVVQSYWKVRKTDLEDWYPVAEHVYQDLVCVLVCGGSERAVKEITLRLLPVFEICRSDWMRKCVARALLTIYALHRDAIGAELAQQIAAVLEPELELWATPPDEMDWLALCSASTPPKSPENGNF